MKIWGLTAIVLCVFLETSTHAALAPQGQYQTAAHRPPARHAGVYGGVDDEDDDYLAYTEAAVPEGIVHPTLPGRSLWLWQYQFVLIIGYMTALYLVQTVIDFIVRKRLRPYVRMATCLMLGANFRQLGSKTRILHFARFFTSPFIHCHVFHLLANTLTVTSAWTFLATIPSSIRDGVWVYHWTFPLFMLCAVMGSAYSYVTTLKSIGMSIGGSGGCLGLTTGFVTTALFLEGLPPHKRWGFMVVVLVVIVSCVPWECVCTYRDVQNATSGLLQAVMGRVTKSTGRHT